ncbi:MAG: ABC transporter ATP-binding protein [Thermoflexales bacterium]|nr:ABC transporter ATP-binding protein [Thermoflexales bacterium]MCS7324049.1 ABC transporter ATP-binding protein [Thermoflexales bacterium]MDW8054007.1 ABC transporter ATP-binding protein [Anaerolineae bacterium]MDW8293139.1 ABC transporter ATP-binding protein [Anaerolineae bacterium]
MSEAPAAIVVRDLWASYNRGRIEALRGVSLTVAAGEIFGLLGPNGAGKTTLLSCVEGLHVPDRGEVSVLGVDVLRHPNAVKRKLGAQLQRTALISNLTALELLEAYAALYDCYPSRQTLMALLERFDLVALAHRRAGQLSGGQQQRLALALALVNDPQIVLLDEPTASLDPQARRAVWALIRQLRDEGRTVVIATHMLDEAEQLCQRVGVINKGRVVACGSPAALIAAAQLAAELRVAVDLPLALLRALPAVSSAEMRDGYALIRSTQPEQTLQALYTLARSHNASVRSIAVRHPTLEEAYLRLMSESAETSAKEA